MRLRLPAGLLLALLLLGRGSARADEEVTAQARQAFLAGVELVKKSQWADALASFERAAALQPHPTTTFSIGACERSLGRYGRARLTFLKALDESSATAQLPAEMASDAHAFIAEIERMMVHLDVHLDPENSAITVDGRPLWVESRPGARPLLLAGILPSGRGMPPPAADFELLLDPGTHVFVLSRAGYSTAVMNRTFEPGAHVALPLELAKLPATIRISANQKDAVVSCDEHDAGVAPVDLLRPSGAYRISVHKKGFETYQTKATVHAGEQVDLFAPLVAKRPIYKQWWFWTATILPVALAVGLGVGLTRTPSPYDGGTTGWVAHPR